MSLLCPPTHILINISVDLSKTVLPNACSCEIHSTCQACYLCTGSGQKPGSHPSLINFFHIPHSVRWQVLPSKYTWTLTTSHHTIAPILVQVHHSSQGLLKYPSSYSSCFLLCPLSLSLIPWSFKNKTCQIVPLLSSNIQSKSHTGLYIVCPPLSLTSLPSVCPLITLLHPLCLPVCPSDR